MATIQIIMQSIESNTSKTCTKLNIRTIIEIKQVIL